MFSILRGLIAVFFAGVISFTAFLLVGAFLPMWAMMLVFGKQNVQDAPGHGSAVLLLTLPAAGILALMGFALLVPKLYRRLSTHRGI